MFTLLPILKGWDYKSKIWTRELTRGEVLEVERSEETGWLMQLTFVSDDAYGGCEVMFQGADLNTLSMGIANAQSLYSIGATAQDPAGWLQAYYRPNPQSTQGGYVGIVTTQGFQGSTLPFVPTTIVKLRLENQSTQAKATVSAQAFMVVITDKKQFIKSLRAVMGANMIQNIDPAVLTSGLQEVTQKGWSEKETNKQ